MTASGTSSGLGVRADQSLAVALRGVCIAAFVVLLVLVGTGILIRFLPMFSLGWADEIVELAFAWMVFLGTAVLWRGRAHFRVDLIPQMLAGSRAGKILEILLSLMALAFFLVFTYEGGMLTLRTVVDSPILALPRALWYMVMPISGLIIIGYTVRDLWLLCHGRLPVAVDVVKESHS
jgi:TRAP-type C4-dicarboxylate transport system permease small subunit